MIEVDTESHPRILDESNNNYDCDDSEKEDGRHDALDAADGGITGRIKLSLIATVILGCTEVRWRKHGNHSLWKRVWSFNYTVHIT